MTNCIGAMATWCPGFVECWCRDNWVKIMKCSVLCWT